MTNKSGSHTYSSQFNQMLMLHARSTGPLTARQQGMVGEGGGKRKREETEETDRQTDRQRQTDRHTDRQTETETETDKQTERERG